MKKMFIILLAVLIIFFITLALVLNNDSSIDVNGTNYSEEYGLHGGGGSHR